MEFVTCLIVLHIGQFSTPQLVRGVVEDINNETWRIDISQYLEINERYQEDNLSTQTVNSNDCEIK